MAKFTLSPLAEADLRQIVEYISRDKPEAALRWVERIRDKLRLLADNPKLGEKRPEFTTGQFRCSLLGNYVIFYRPVDAGIDVARVVRGERDIRAL